MKKAQHLIQEPNSLFADQVFKAKYYPSTFVLFAPLKRSDSWAWRSTYKGLQHLKPNIKWIVGM